ncbi:MAG: M15 family metallopeptidase [Prolixibacteraceae bacterium]
MKKSLFFTAALFAGLLLLSWNQPAKKENPYRLDVMATLAAYDSAIHENPSNQLVNLEKAVPGIVLDIRYATANNFTHQPVYPAPKAYVRKPVAEALMQIQQELNSKGMGLKIYDAYRPYAVTLKFFQLYPDTNFVASPKTGSRHNRGCAIDLTIIDIRSGKELEMPTSFDNFTERASHSFQDLSPDALQNRNILRETMIRHGFEALESEWWHYDFSGWRNFKIMDIAFDELNN